eukprot:5477879-Prymnesium_polylepis.1
MRVFLSFSARAGLATALPPMPSMVAGKDVLVGRSGSAPSTCGISTAVAATKPVVFVPEGTGVHHCTAST